MDAVNLSGYQITEQLYTGTRTLVYRAIRTSDQYPVVIKILRNQYPNFNELIGFRNQYTIAKNLDFPSIIQPLSLEVYGNSYALVMEDFGGTSLSTYLKTETDRNQLSNSLSLKEFLSLALQLADILHYLYQNRVIHKDIKPANILINPETKQVKLIDFSIASLLPRETQEIQNPNVLEGTLAYLSPEQTGRMNRGIDYRSDFYSLGVTFYELLTGQLPFMSNDLMELVHCHVAKQSILIHQINPEISLVLSKIVSQLMAKNAENRYQSALGLKHDLEICLTQLQATGEIADFELGKRDITDRFLIPEKLYGRETEVETLLQAFERVSLGATEMMLVAGFSGIGKTVVVNEVHKPIVRLRGYFIKGKYDQFQRNIPFSAFVQAFRDLMGQLLSESDAQLQTWKTKILEAAGDNGQVLIDVIPELELIIGTQPAATELSGTAAQNRFNLLIQKFIKVFTSQEHPLVMFMDDLQWADSASLKLLELLIEDTGHLLVLGAYRDNEVSPAHPFILTVDEIVKTGAVVNTITLQPLSLEDMNQLVADTLNCELSVGEPLTKLVSQKTKGNPFFATQFLKALHDDKLIIFNWDLRHWQCDIAQVKVLALTSDVVEFMALQLQKLPTETQNILKLAACIGAQFDLNTLAIVSQNKPEDVAIVLWKALQEEMIIPNTEIYKFFMQSDTVSVSDAAANPTYRFLHDRVQQAAYSLIPEDQRLLTHFNIGQLLLEKTSKSEREEKIFDIVGHLNLGAGLIYQQSQQYDLAQLNLIAGQKAKSSTAYMAAFEYLNMGIKMLAEDSWQTEYKLTLDLYLEATEVVYLKGDLESMERLGNTVLDCANNLLDKIKVYETHLQAYAVQNQFIDGILVGLSCLRLLGVDLPENPDTSEIGAWLNRTQKALDPFSSEELIDLPEMSDPTMLSAMRILSRMISLSYFGRPSLLPLIACQEILLSLEYGNTIDTPVAYVNYAVILCNPGVDSFVAGYKYGHVAKKMLERQHNKQRQPDVLNNFYSYVFFWTEHSRDGLSHLLDAYQSGLEVGNFEYAAYAITNRMGFAYSVGQPLDGLKQGFETAIEFAGSIKFEGTKQYTSCLLQVVLNLINSSDEPWALQGEAYDENTAFEIFQNSQNFLGLSIHCFSKMHLNYLFGRILEAADFIIEGEKYLGAICGYLLLPEFTLFASLTHLAATELTTDSQKTEHFERAQGWSDRLKLWAENAPMNNQHKYDLVAAEKSRLQGENWQAAEMYDRAIVGAKENQYLNEESLANELAAKFYLEWGKEKVAQGYMIEAYYCYSRWGAKAKVVDIETRYPQLLGPILQQPQTSFNPLETLTNITHSSTQVTSTTISNTLDFASVIKAAQALSGTIQLDELLKELTQIILQNSGGSECVLVLPQNGTWQVKAISTPEVTKLCSEPLDGHSDVPIKLIQYVKRTQSVVVIDNLQTDLPVVDDYLIQRQPKSVLCLPILNQGHLAGILYLKNEMTAGVFTSDRLTVIEFLCTQAAISLENARLYGECKASEQSLQETNNLLNSFLEAMPDYFFAKDLKGRYLTINSNTGKLFNLTIHEMIGKTDIELMPLELAEALNQVDREVMSQDITKRVEEISLVDGIENIFLSVKTPLKNMQGDIIGIIGIAQNISDRKRTEALITQKTQELEQALQTLQQTQLQMIQSEKMSALGNLVAGVAHEINNPVGFVSGNLNEAQQTVQDLVDHLNLYREQASPVDITNHAEDIDIDYIIEDLPKMIDSMKLGCDRIKGISTSLRTFSRADTDCPVACNIHDGIDSTIMILKHRLKANENRPEIAVIKDYGDLPPIECYAGQLNQVFMNLLGNAIDALDESNQGMSYQDIANQITIKTELLPDKQVVIQIQDNGKGMTEEVNQKIFDHLFTTKAVGKGTGLGLAIARQIIEEKHSGSIHVNSLLGAGTEFIITLPTKASQTS